MRNKTGALTSADSGTAGLHLHTVECYPGRVGCVLVFLTPFSKKDSCFSTMYTALALPTIPT